MGLADTLSRLVARVSVFREVLVQVMSARAALSAVLFAIAVLLASTPSARAGAWSLAPGEYYSELRGGGFSSDHYYDQDGTKLPLARGGVWEERSLTSYTELGWKKKVSFVLEIPAVSVTRRFGLAAGGTTVPTATGLGDVTVGFRWKLANERRAAALELDWKAPLGYEKDQFLTHADSVEAGSTPANPDLLDENVAHQVGSPVLGDGQNDVTLSLQLGTALGQWGFLQAGGGYRYRFENPGNQVVGSADVGWWLARDLLVAGCYRGETTIEDMHVPSSKPIRHRVGPMLVYRVDERLDLILATMHTAAAQNALHTDEVFVGVAFRHTKLNRLQGFLGGSSKP